MVKMKDKVSSKLSEIYKSLEAARKYGVDVRMEDKKYAECNIAFSKAQYINDERFHIINSELKKREQEKFNSILQDLFSLENIILDKRKIYQVKETLNGMFEKVKSCDLNQNIKDFIVEVKRQLEIYNSSKIPEMYSPEIVINEIFRIIYETIKIEWLKYGNSKLLNMVTKDESSMARISSFLNKDVETLGKILGTNDESIVKIRNYMFGNKGEIGKVLIDEQLVNMVVNTITSHQVEDTINLQTVDMQSELDDKVKEVSKSREEYVGLAKLQNKARKFVVDIRKKIDKRVAPIVLSLVIMSGVGFGTCNVLSSTTVNNETETTINEVDRQSNIRTLGATVERKDQKNETPLMTAGACALASAFIPKIGLAFQGVSLCQDKRKYNKTIKEIVIRKSKMEELKSNLEKMVQENNQYSKQANKQRELMMWASVYSGITEEQMELLNSISESLNSNNHVLENLDEEFLVDDDTIDKSRNRRLIQ